MLDCTYRVQIPHRAGQLASVARAIAALAKEVELVPDALDKHVHEASAGRSGAWP